MTQPPVVLSGQQIYDMIMSGIEADLTSTQLPLLSQKYAHETADEKSARADRYTKAFEAYEKKFQEYCDQWSRDLRTYKRTAISTLEQKARTTEEQTQLEHLESSFASA